MVSFKLSLSEKLDLSGEERRPRKMALQAAGVSTSKVLVLVGAGLTGSIVLRSGRLSDLIAQLHELLKGVNEAEILSEKYDGAIIRAQIQQLAQEIRELTLSGPVTIFKENSASSAAALGAMGYCYMWWKGWSLSDVMYVTKHNMANAVATVSKQLEHVHETLVSTKRHLTKKLENLAWKMEEQKEISELIANDVNEVKSNLSQIGFDVELIHQMVAGLEGKVELIESKQDATNSGLWYLCQVAEGFKDGLDAKPFQNVSAKLGKHSTMALEDKSLKGLQFLADTKEPSVTEKSTTSAKKNDPDNFPGEVPRMKTRIHRSYPVGIALTRDITGSDL
ncbi:Protein of unknown function D [Prunus dulcis]|uniref:DUF1664 domain-containing protein n=1 Tax=Prunus dulcis TaxID=3755 RepID=A0A4Y1R710_PRUDU|nr:Protein of unknown function D [Prunus dulcis]